MKFEGFNWDIGNTDKCQKHGLTQEEIERFFQQKEIYVADIKHSTIEERFLAIGKGSENKLIVVAFTFRTKEEKNLSDP